MKKIIGLLKRINERLDDLENATYGISMKEGERFTVIPKGFPNDSAKTSTLEFKCDSSPLEAFTDVFDTLLKVGDIPFSLPDCPGDLIRVEQDNIPASAGKVVMTLYPSDSFLRFFAAFRAGQSDIEVVE